MRNLILSMVTATGVLAAAFAAPAWADTYFWMAPVAPKPTDRISMNVIAGVGKRTTPYLYITEMLDNTGGPTQRIRGNETLRPDGSSSAYFTFRLAVGSYVVGYYQSPHPDTTQPADGSATIVVTATGPIPVVEYIGTATGHYFITADPAEMRKLDDGTTPGWTRTGESFRAVVPGSSIRVRPLCRLYGVFAGTDTHLYSDVPDECDGLMARWPQHWQRESAYSFALVHDFYSDCDNSDEMPLYRLFNNRADVNHRYTTSIRIRDAMLAAGWILEPRYEWSTWWACASP